jgi:hypothetical protein
MAEPFLNGAAVIVAPRHQQPTVIKWVAAFLRRVSTIEAARCPHCGSGNFRVVAALWPQRRLPDPRGSP